MIINYFDVYNRNLDKNNNGFVDRNEFTWGLAEHGLKFPKNDID